MRTPLLFGFCFITASIVLLVFAHVASAQSGPMGQTSMGEGLSQTTDEELAGLLASRDELVSRDAARETFRRGEQ